MITTRVDIIRHGEPTGGAVLRGRTDHPLTALGQWQFEERIARVDGEWNQIVSSPLQRCQAAAAQVAQRQQIPLLLEPRLRELNFGAWEGQLLAELAATEVGMQQLWENPFEFCAPQGESVRQLQQRVMAYWHELLDHYAGQQVLLVSHGGVMRVLAQALLGLSAEGMNRLAIPYAGWLRFKVIHDQYQGQAHCWVSLEQMDGTELLPPKKN